MTFRLSLFAIIASAFLTSCASPDGGRASHNFKVSGDNINAAEPAVTFMPNGDLAVVWVEHKQSGADVLLRTFDGQGNAKGDAVRVNTVEGAAKTWRGDPPSMAVTVNGTVYVSWTASMPGGKGTTLYLSTSRDSGKTFEPPVKVNDDEGAVSHGMHSVAADDNGKVYVAWLDERYLATMREPESHHDDEMKMAEPNAELYFATSSDGGKTFSSNRRIAQDACPCCKTAITSPTRDGHMFIGWRQVLPGSFRHISVIGSVDGGNTFGQPVVVADDKWKIDACPVSGPSLSLDGDALEVAWFAGGDAGPHGVYWTHSHDLNELKFSEPLLVGEAVATGTPVIAKDHVIWSDQGHLRSAAITDHRVEKPTDLGDGSVPAFAEGDGVGVVAYTEEKDKLSSVWLRLMSPHNTP
jgi:hypothetical protein